MLEKVGRFIHKARIGPNIGEDLEHFYGLPEIRSLDAAARKLRPGLTDLAIAYGPERVLPGRILTELVENDRVAGGLTPEATRRAQAFYRLFVRGEVVGTDAATAEMVKLSENAFRDVNIAFANELSQITHSRTYEAIW